MNENEVNREIYNLEKVLLCIFVCLNFVLIYFLSFHFFLGTSEKDIFNILKRFDTSFDQVVGIVCYCEVPDVTKLINVIVRNFPKFRIIGSDTTLTGNKSNKSLIFSLAYQRDDVSEFFDVYDKLTFSNSVSNPWFHRFWNESCEKLKKKNIDCTNETAFTLCGTSSLALMCPRDDKIPYTIDAIYAFAYAIRDLLRDELQNNVTRLRTMDLKNRDFFDNYLKKVRFRGRSGNVTFEDDKERGSYDVIQFYGKHRLVIACLLYTSPSPRDGLLSRMPSSA